MLLSSVKVILRKKKDRKKKTELKKDTSTCFLHTFMSCRQEAGRDKQFMLKKDMDKKKGETETWKERRKESLSER